EQEREAFLLLVKSNMVLILAWREGSHVYLPRRQQDGSEDTASLFWDSRNHQSKSTMRSLS
ncbi:unnamed protein product, partial [Musa hybrid cultivar]